MIALYVMMAGEAVDKEQRLGKSNIMVFLRCDREDSHCRSIAVRPPIDVDAIGY